MPFRLSFTPHPLRVLAALLTATVFEVVVMAFPAPLPSPVPANEAPFANLLPGQYAVLTNITNTPANDDRACSIRLSQNFDRSGQAAVIYVIKEDTLAPAGQWDWIDKYNIVLVNLGLWDNQPFYTDGYTDADGIVDNGILPMLQGARYLVEKYYNPDPQKFYVSGWSIGGDLFTLLSTRPAWRGVIKGVIGTPGATIASGDPTTVPIAERGWVRYFNGCGSNDGAASYGERTEQMRLAGVRVNQTVLWNIGHSTPEPIREPGYLWFRGRGLNVEYWDGANFATLLSGAGQTRQEMTLNFSWLDTQPYEYAPALTRLADYSLRFTGLVQPRFTETYTFHATADDGVRVWVNNTPIIDQWVGQTAAVTSTGALALAGGQPVPLRVDYYRAAGPGTLRLEWSSTSQTREVLPTMRTYYGGAASVPSAPVNNGAWSRTETIGAWFDGASWSGGVTAFGAGRAAQFTNDIAADQLISVNGDVTIGSIAISDDGTTLRTRTLVTGEDGILNLQPASGVFSDISVREGQAVVNVPVYGAQGLRKLGAGALRLNGDAAYGGTTRVEEGFLRIAGRFVSPRIELASSAIFELQQTGTLQFNGPNATKNALTGLGTFRKSGTGTMQLSNNGRGCIVSLDAGSLIEVNGGRLLNGSFTNSDWTQNFASLAIASGATFDVWNGGPIRVDALTGAGAITNGLNGGATSMTVGVANGSGTYAGTLRAVGLTLTKTGGGVETLTGSAMSVVALNVNQGVLAIAGPGTHALGNVNVSGTGQLRLAARLSASSSTAAASFSAGTFAANAQTVLDVTLNAPGSTVVLVDPFWTQPRTWTPVSATSMSGALALGNVSADPAGRAASDVGSFSVQNSTAGAALAWTPAPFTTWRVSKFGATQTAAANIGFNADPDQDLVPNLLEYALGAEPLTSDAAQLPKACVANGRLTLTYTRLKSSTDLVVRAEAAGQIDGIFSPAGVTVLSQVDAGDRWIVTEQDSVPLASQPLRFMRLRVTRP